MKLGGRKGHSVVEVALMAPWLFFLFVGICDFGFYAHALISTENAARAAAVSGGRYSSDNFLTSAVSVACPAVLAEMQTMPNASSFSTGCNAPPLQVTMTQFTDSEGNYGVQVQVTYRPIPMIPLPGLLPQQLSITRTVSMPSYGTT